MLKINDKLDSRLLLHICCAPCALSPVPEFFGRIEYSGFFFNPNIYDSIEYEKRLFEVEKISEIFKFPLIVSQTSYYDFIDFVKGLENEPEGGARCLKCFELRLSETFKYAKQNNFKYIATTLSTSPHKNISAINAIASRLSERFSGVTFLEYDFKKNEGYKKSIERCKSFSIYRQNYCGCSFSIHK